jgi:hypothetical protein
MLERQGKWKWHIVLWQMQQSKLWQGHHWEHSPDRWPSSWVPSWWMWAFHFRPRARLCNRYGSLLVFWTEKCLLVCQLFICCWETRGLSDVSWLTLSFTLLVNEVDWLYFLKNKSDHRILYSGCFSFFTDYFGRIRSMQNNNSTGSSFRNALWILQVETAHTRVFYSIYNLFHRFRFLRHDASRQLYFW